MEQGEGVVYTQGPGAGSSRLRAQPVQSLQGENVSSKFPKQEGSQSGWGRVTGRRGDKEEVRSERGTAGTCDGDSRTKRPHVDKLRVFELG